MNASSFSGRFQIYPEQCEQAKWIKMKTDEYEYGAL